MKDRVWVLKRGKKIGQKWERKKRESRIGREREKGKDTKGKKRKQKNKKSGVTILVRKKIKQERKIKKIKAE